MGVVRLRLALLLLLWRWISPVSDGAVDDSDDDNDVDIVLGCLWSKEKSKFPLSYCISLRRIVSTSQSGNSVPIRSMSMSCGMPLHWLAACVATGSEPERGRAVSAERVMWRGCDPLRVGV